MGTFPYVSNNSELFAEFVLDSHDRIDKSFKKIKRTLIGALISKSPKSQTLTQSRIKWYLQHGGQLHSEILQKNWSNSLDMTFLDMYNSKNRLKALELCKDPSEDIIMLAAMVDPWLTLMYCLKRDLLSGRLLTNLSRCGEKTITSNTLSDVKCYRKINDG